MDVPERRGATGRETGLEELGLLPNITRAASFFE